ncbi:MAG: hypothetical protein EBZ75_08530, partial [Oxalobacteraceae bacterium]|nr:hypothetical protein [Oxalobacteraceae bacterium]
MKPITRLSRTAFSTVAAFTVLKSASLNATFKFFTVAASVWVVATPEKVRRAVVSETLTSCAVKPAGTPVTVPSLAPNA